MSVELSLNRIRVRVNHSSPLGQKPKKEQEEKRVVREGRNSLITYPNASSFSIYSHIRHLVLQTQLCETYNSRLAVESEGQSESEADEDDEKKVVEQMPVVRGHNTASERRILPEFWGVL